MAELQIKLKKCLLILSENELMSCLALKPEIFQRAVGRGKARSRVEKARQRQLKANAEGFNRWRLYEALKKDTRIENTVIGYVEGMDTTEMREGLVEFLATRGR